MEGVRVGDLIAAYRIESVIGRGGMSVVYLAEHIKLGRKVTLKVLAPELAADPTFRERFVRESRLAATLDHPHIVPIYEADEVEGRLFIAMRYVRGTDLDVLIKTEGPLPLDRTVSIIGQVASALDAAHAEGLVHRDVKPANILVAPGVGPGAADHTYLSDFGITKRLSYTTASASGEIMGTVDYVAPEQIEGGDVDGRADVYSLGCVLYQCLAGTVPFPKDSELAVLWAHTRERPPKVTAARTEVPADLDPVIAKAMAKRREDRYQRCAELSFDARRAARIDHPAPQQMRSSRMRRLAPPIAAVVALAVTAVVAAVLILPNDGSETSGGTFNVTLRRIDANKGQLTDHAWAAPSDAIGMADGNGGEWVTTRHDVVFVPVAGSGKMDVQIGFTPSDIDVGIGDVWVVGADGPNEGDLIRIDPAGFAEPKLTTFENPVEQVDVGLGSVWVMTNDGSSRFIIRVDPVTLTHRSTRPAPGAVGLAVGAHGVWFVSSSEDTLSRLDLRHDLPDSTMVSGAPTGVGAGDDSVWVMDRVHNQVIRVDPETQTSDVPIVVGNQPFDVEFTDGIAWVANAKSVCKIDVPSQPFCARVEIGHPVVAIAADVTAPSTRAQIWVLVRTPSTD